MYELWNQRNIERFTKPKLITLDNASKNSFAYDNSGFLGSTTVYSIILSDRSFDIKYLLGILNSKLLTFYHQNNTIPQAGGFYRYQAIFIKDIPIKKSNNQKPITLIVDQILSAKKADPKADTSALEKKIDELVYKLYDLTEDEIILIEGDFK